MLISYFYDASAESSSSTRRIPAIDRSRRSAGVFRNSRDYVLQARHAIRDAIAEDALFSIQSGFQIGETRKLLFRADRERPWLKRRTYLV